MKIAYSLRLSLIVALFSVAFNLHADWGIFQTYAVVNTGDGNIFRAGGANADNNRSVIGHDFGTFRSTDTFVLNGAEFKTWKNGSSNVCGGQIFYRIYPTGSPSGSFSTVSVSYAGELGGGDQIWQNTSANVNLLSTLADGSYTLELYWEAYGNDFDPNGCGGSRFDSNSGNNWQSTFRVDNSPARAFKMDGAGETKTGYASGTVTLSGISWLLNEALLGDLSPSDKLNGTRSIRIRRSGTTEGIAEMQEDLTTGVGKIGFNYARYGNETGQPDLFVEYSVNGGAWTQAGSTISSFNDQLTYWESTINEEGNVRIRFRTGLNGTNEDRINIDDIFITENICTGESFANFPTTPATSYTTRTWTGDGGGSWQATEVRGDGTLNGTAITLRNSGSPTLTAPTTTDGIGVVRLTAVRAFTNTNARNLSVFVNGEQIGSNLVVDPNSDIPQSFELVANVSGTAQLTVVNNGSQVTIDDVSWTCYRAPIETGTVSASEFILSDCNSTATGTAAFTTNTSFGAGNTFTAELSDANGDFLEPLTIGTGTASPISITIPENLPSGTGYRIRVVSSDPAYIGTLSTAFTITQNGADCPTLGDFRSRASGSWTNANSWQVYSYDGSSQTWSWIDTTEDPNNVAVNVTIRNGDTIELSISGSVDVNNLVVESGATLVRNSTSCSAVRYINLAGDIINNGVIGNGATPDALGLQILAGDHTITGSGSFDAYRIRLAGTGASSTGTLGSATLTIDQDLTLRWYETACSGGFNAIYNNRGATSTFDITITAGNTLTLTGADATLGMDAANTGGGNFAASEQGGGYSVEGSIVAAGAYVAGSNNTGAQQVYLNIQNGGSASFRYIEVGNNNGTDGGAITLADGASLNITGVATGTTTWANPTVGSLVFTIDPNSTVTYSGAAAQDIPAITAYGNLALSGAGSKNFTDSETTIQGDFSFATGLTVDATDPGFVLNVGGDWNNNGGTFNAANGTVVFNGAAAQTIGGSATTRFENISLNSGNDLLLGTNTEVHGVLNPINGDFDGQTFDLRLVSDVDGTGSIGEITANASFTGNTIIERYIPTGVQFWTQLAAPIAGHTVEDWNASIITTGFTGSDFPTNSFNNVRQYDETVAGLLNEGFVGVTATSDVLDHVRGYFVFMQGANQFVSVEGDIQQGPLTTALNYTSTGVPANDGWELVANRYPSEIDFDLLHANSTGIADHYYIYDADAGSYAFYTVGFGPTGDATGNIASSQAFWVQTIASNAELLFTEDIKSATGQQFQRSYAAVPRITLAITDGDKTHRGHIAFGDEFAQAFDHGRDAVWFPSGEPEVPQIATVATTGERLSLNRMNTPQGDAENIPVFVRANQTGTYTFTVEVLENLPAGLCISIEDLFTGNIQAVNEGDQITWEQAEAFEGTRFIIHLSVPMAAVAEAAACFNQATGSVSVDLFANAGVLTLETENGDIVATETVAGQTAATFENLAAGSYIARFTSADLVCNDVAIALEVGQPEIGSAPAASSSVAACNEAIGSIAIDGFIGDFTATVYRDGVLIGEYEAAEVLTIEGLDPGFYTLETADACVSSSFSLDLNDPNALNATVSIAESFELINGSAEITAELFASTSSDAVWTINGVEVAQGSFLSTTVTEPGTYTYTVLATGDACNELIEGSFVVNETVSVAESAANALILAHTPTGWMVTGLTATEAVHIDVYGADGKLVIRAAASIQNNLLIENQQLASGIYTLVVSDAQGTPIATLNAVR